MLVLSRRLHEKILFPSLPAALQVVRIKPGVVRIGIDAPPGVPVLRAELSPRAAAAPPPAPPVRQMVQKRLEVIRSGLALLQRELAFDRKADAEMTLAKLDEDVRLLEARLEREMGAPPAAALHRPALRALLVEDNANERQLLAEILRIAGLEVVTGGDGADALDLLHRGDRPDVILLDMGLPRCDGATMVRALRRDPAYAGLKIFAVTGHTPDEFDLARGPGGVDRWFHKPIDPINLVRDVHRALGVDILSV
jgi:carbon storage regulator CsrA